MVETIRRGRSVGRRGWLALGMASLAVAASATGAGERLRSASPGETGAGIAAAAACPTFSWGAVSDAAGYRLLVVELDATGAAGPVRLRRDLEGGAIASWTPPLDACLAPGGDYAWTVAALRPGGAVEEGSASAPRRFHVGMTPTETEIAAALELLARARFASAGDRAGGSVGRSSGLAPSSPDAPAAPLGGGSAAVRAVSSVAGGVGVYAENTSPNGYGVRAEVDGDLAHAIHATNHGTGNPSIAIEGESYGVNGWGIHGNAWSTTGQNYGVRGDSRSPSGAAVLGLSNPTGGGGMGVAGETFAVDGTGVFGRNTNPAGDNYGVRGDVSSPTGRAVYGISRATTGTSYGVYGSAASSSGRGVFGQAPSSGYAGYFSGRVHVTGTLSKGSGSFQIDHPLDPENRYLYHSFVESPEMKNVYDGVVRLDASGSAWVEMPGWFEALNRDFRYQLTPIGGASLVWVGREIEDGRFEVRGAPGARVSWQVTGVRHDRFAEWSPIPVEEWKPDGERGTYLHPEAWGVDPRLGLAARDALRAESPVPPPAPGPESARAPR